MKDPHERHWKKINGWLESSKLPHGRVLLGSATLHSMSTVLLSSALCLLISHFPSPLVAVLSHLTVMSDSLYLHTGRAFLSEQISFFQCKITWLLFLERWFLDKNILLSFLFSTFSFLLGSCHFFSYIKSSC